MKRRRVGKPVVLKSVNSLADPIALCAIIGLLTVGLSVSLLKQPTVRDCGCGKKVIVTQAEKTQSASVAAAVSLPILAIAAAFASLRRRALRSLSTEDLCRRFGTDRTTLQRLTEEQGIQPRFVISGDPHYELRDFNLNDLHEAAILLRASSSHAHEAELLRASQPRPSWVPADQLVRPTYDTPGTILDVK